MLRHITFKNFKSWRTADIEFGRITAFFGTNSSGKTSLTQFILLLKQTKDARDRQLALDFGDANSFVNLGSFRDAVYGHDTKLPISWTIDWSLPSKLTIVDPDASRSTSLVEGNNLAMEGRVEIRKDFPSSRYLCYEIGGRRFSLSAKESETEFALEPSPSHPQDGFAFRRNLGRPWQLPGPVKSYLFPDQAKTYFQNSGFLGQFEAAFEEFMDHVFYLGPLRQYPQRQYSWSGARPTDVGRSGEKFVDAFLAARASGERQNLGKRKPLKTFDEIIAHWLKELGLIHQFRVDEIGKGSNLYSVKVRRTPNSEEALITDVGFGVSQILPVIVLLWYVRPGSTIILEQPEIHLHPMVQSGLADVIATAAVHRNIQVIIESHSEHLLRRLQLRVAEEELSKSDLRLYFCDFERDQSKMSPLQVNEEGQILNWPKNFFGDEFGEVARIELAALKRRKKREKNGD